MKSAPRCLGRMAGKKRQPRKESSHIVPLYQLPPSRNVRGKIWGANRRLDRPTWGLLDPVGRRMSPPPPKMECTAEVAPINFTHQWSPGSAQDLCDAEATPSVCLPCRKTSSPHQSCFAGTPYHGHICLSNRTAHSLENPMALQMMHGPTHVTTGGPARKAQAHLSL